MVDATTARAAPANRPTSRIDQARWESDAIGDAVVAWMQTLPQGRGRALLDEALASGIGALPDAPPPLAELFAQVDRVPPWLDRRALRLATGTILRCAVGSYTALAGSSLIGGYRSGSAVKPLVMTGALERMAARRLVETGVFIMNVAGSRVMSRFSEGFKTTVRVRVMHATVRRSLLSSPKWRSDLWGTPINQRDTVGTMLQFSVAYARGLNRLGFILSRRELDALVHLWRYVAVLLGTPEELLPTDYAEALALEHSETLAVPDGDDDSRALTAALLNVPRLEVRDSRLSRAVGELASRFLGGYSRHVLGADVADMLGLPDDAWQFAPRLFKPLVNALEVMRMLTPGGRRIAVRLGHAWENAYLRERLAGEPARFYK